MRKLILDMEKKVNSVTLSNRIDQTSFLIQDQFEKNASKIFLGNLTKFEEQMLEMQKKFEINYFINEDKTAILEGLPVAD